MDNTICYLRFSTSCISRIVSSLFRHFQKLENVEIKMKLVVKYNLLKNADNEEQSQPKNRVIGNLQMYLYMKNKIEKSLTTWLTT